VGARHRIPTLLVSKKFDESGVDHTAYDTTSILKLIEDRYHLKPLGPRDAKVTSLKKALEVAD
jgi:phospholipase C